MSLNKVDHLKSPLVLDNMAEMATISEASLTGQPVSSTFPVSESKHSCRSSRGKSQPSKKVVLLFKRLVQIKLINSMENSTNWASFLKAFLLTPKEIRKELITVVAHNIQVEKDMSNKLEKRVLQRWRTLVKDKRTMERLNREHMIALRFGRLAKKALIMPLLVSSLHRSMKFKMIARKMVKMHNHKVALSEHSGSKQKQQAKEPLNLISKSSLNQKLKSKVK